MCLVRPDVHASNACLGVAGWGFSSAGKSEMPRVVDKRQSHAGALLALACSPPAPLLHKALVRRPVIRHSRHRWHSFCQLSIPSFGVSSCQCN